MAKAEAEVRATLFIDCGLTKVIEWRKLRPASIGDDNVHPSELLDRFIGDTLDAGPIESIALN